MNKKIENKKLETVVIEDCSGLLRIAKKAYEKREDLNPHYFSDYESAMNYMQNNKVDLIVSDLFFPAKVNFIEYFHKKMEKSELRPEAEADFLQLDENPSGLGIAEYCIRNKIPFILASQGDRHIGNLGIVRYALMSMPEFGKHFGGHDCLPRMTVYGGAEVDKTEEKTWIDALSDKYSTSLLHLAKREGD